MGLVKRFTYEQVRNLERQPNQVKGSFALVSSIMNRYSLGGAHVNSGHFLTLILS